MQRRCKLTCSQTLRRASNCRCSGHRHVGRAYWTSCKQGNDNQSPFPCHSLSFPWPFPVFYLNLTSSDSFADMGNSLCITLAAAFVFSFSLDNWFGFPWQPARALIRERRDRTESSCWECSGAFHSKYLCVMMIVMIIMKIVRCSYLCHKKKWLRR